MIFQGTPQLCGGVYILFFCKVSFQKHPTGHSRLRVVMRVGSKWANFRYFKTPKAPIYYPHQWLKWCFSLNTTSGRAAIVMDGIVLREEITEDFAYNETVWATTPDNLSIHFGAETHAQFTDLNIWSEPLGLDRLVAITENGGEECGALGDWLNWEEAEFTLHNPNGSQIMPPFGTGHTLGICIDYDWDTCVLGAKWLEVNEGQGPCWRKSTFWIFWFPFNMFHHSFCMEHCQKLGTRSPPVRTLAEWERYMLEVDSVRDIDKQKERSAKPESRYQVFLLPGLLDETVVAGDDPQVADA